MMSWDDYWKQYSISKAERWMIGVRHRKLMGWIDSLGGDKKRVVERTLSSKISWKNYVIADFQPRCFHFSRTIHHSISSHGFVPSIV